MSPDFMSGIRANLRLLFRLPPPPAVGPMCGGGGGGGGGSGGVVLPPFNVVAQYPVSTTPPVGRTQQIYLTVNGIPAAATMNGTNIVVMGGAGAIPATYSFDPVLSQIVVTPQGPGFLDSNTNHTVNVLAGLQTVGGSSMTPMSFSFTTANTADTTLPGAPGALATGATTVNTIDTSWTTGSDNVTTNGNLVYDIYISTTAGQTNFAVDPYRSTAGGALTFTVNALSSHTIYYFVIRTRDQAGNRSANTAQISGQTKVKFSTDLYNAIINNPATGHCTNCHTPGSPMGSFMVLTPDSNAAWNAWVGVNSAAGAGPSPAPSCGAPGPVWIRVDPGSLATSLVYQKIGAAFPCGVRMPEDGAVTRYLTGTEIQVFADWINEGAPNN